MKVKYISEPYGYDEFEKEIDTSSGIPTDTLKDMFINLDKNLGNKWGHNNDKRQRNTTKRVFWRR